MSQSIKSRNFSLLIIAIAAIAFVYIVAKAAIIVDKRQIGTGEGIYTNCVTTSPYIEEKARSLVEGCRSELCEVQRVLDYVTAIPYQINHFRAHKPTQTIENGYGDCDDKSNLLISLLHALGKEAYFVLVPHHIFVITPLDDTRIADKKGVWIDGKKFYVLESTAKGSRVGYPLGYRVEQIEMIFDPFINEALAYQRVSYK
ncbi:transglutaminase-like domain-containing protein [Sulfurovum mangrovi]|uniref:transglutaminase-like domain-containing protein n=1 Tax=Sulfurovum mangrovi TaxID=2893889 RepID=UPI001E40718E|nr:transglutaminase-like domain-containing protein [Sulfurovum mangrovi]UFH58791.1 transglutaminase-like domain-containing protein [Sulfurovum mangrovi]